MDYVALKNEILTDPSGLGYPQGYDGGIVNIINAPNSGITVNLAYLDKNDVMVGLVPLILALPSSPPQVQMIWGQLLDSIRAATTPINFSLPNVQLMIAAAVSGNLLTTTDVLGMTTRIGSRAEQLFGTNIVVGQNDVSFALRGY